MANIISPLVSYTNISPNKSKRTQKIDTIVIHCMAGNLTAKKCADLFANKSRGASSNYCVDSKGSISCACPENYRSWCTSSSKVDQRGITIEVANDGGANTGWHVSTTALNALVILIVDVCKRNGIAKLVWSTNKDDRINHRNGCNMEVHRDHAAKACPGNYLMSMHPWIVQQVNAQLEKSPVTASTPAHNSSAKPVNSIKKITNISDPQTYIWNFFNNILCNDFGTAGIMGNIQQESGYNSKNLQNSFEKKLGHNDDSYTLGVDTGTYTKFTSDGAGYGIAQWTHSSRKSALKKYTDSKNASISDLQCQLEFLWIELSKNKALVQTLRTATSVKQASVAFMLQFEKPADKSVQNQQARTKLGEVVYAKYHKAEKPTTPNNSGLNNPDDSGETQGKYKSGLYDYGVVFNPEHYAIYNNDLKTVFGYDSKKLFNHFLTYGMKEGRRAIAGFDPKVYRKYNPDLDKSFGNNYNKYYQHYIKYGKKEGRRAI